MRIKKSVLAGSVVDVHNKGSELAIIKASSALRVRGFDGYGNPVLDTELFQGDSLSGVECVLYQFAADVTQDFIIWSGNFEYKFNKQADRVRDVRGYEVALRHGVRKLINEDPARVRAKMTAPVDMWVGGSNMVAGNGIVSNGRRFAANETFEVESYGDVFYWVTDESQKIFKEYTERARYAQNNGRTALEANGVPYFDIDVPPELDGVPFNLKAHIRHKSRGVDGLAENDFTNISVRPAFYITVGDFTTEELIEYSSYGKTGIHNGTGTDDETLDVNVTLGAGVHRVFPVETVLDGDSTTVAGHEWYGDSFTRFIKIYSDDQVLTVRGYAQILEERA
ncbi:hypothetical protein ACU8V4_06345 [Pseudoalteromonas mariniglutinosa]